MRTSRMALGGVGAAAGLAVALGLFLGAAWLRPGDGTPAVPEAEETLPVPPVPPRLAQGAEYEQCLSMLTADPLGARTFADAWLATGGGEGAEHCSALALIELGEADTGAERLEVLASRSRAAPAARAAVFGQAGQAWMMAGAPDRALGATTMALTMTPNDPDLLIDRSIADGTLEHYQEAVDDITQALAQDPRRADALVLRAAAWRHLNRLDLAQEDVDRALVLDGESADALLERGILRQRRGDRAGARADWERAMEISPDTATGDLAQQNLALLDAGPERR